MHVVDTLAPGGAERMAVEIANLIDPTEFNVLLCATRSGGSLESALATHVRCRQLARTGRWDLKGIRDFARLVRSESVQIVHSHGLGSMRFVSFSALVAGLRCHHVFHNHFGALGPEVRAHPADRICARIGFDDYIAVDRRLCDWGRLRLGVAADRVHLVRNGVDLERFAHIQPLDVRAEFGLPRGSLVLVMLAHLRPEKDHPTLLRALARSRHRERARLLLVGRCHGTSAAYVQACKALADELGIGDNVVYLGERHDVPSLLAGCDLGVLSSRFESGPLALLEYLAAGICYAVTATGEVTEAVREAAAGHTVPVGDVDALSAAIDALGDLTEAERIAMGHRGRELVMRDFDQRATAARVMELYRALIARG